MANVATALKEEITRLARKEIRSEIAGVKKASAQYRSEIAALKRRVAALEKQLSRAEKNTGRNKAEVQVEPEAAGKARFTAKGFKSLRERLGLSGQDIGQLLGVTAQTVYSWESGKSSPRGQQLAKIVALRGMGKRKVAVMLEETAE